MNKSVKLLTVSLLTLLLGLQANAAPLTFSDAQQEKDKKPYKISEMGWVDHNFINKQVASIDELARKNLGTEVRQNLSDLELLQRIVDNGLIDQDDTQQLQAMGAVLGNVMTADVPALEWKIYEDNVGRSRALCAKGSDQCLFPMTMLSRRMETGLKPDVSKIYEEAIGLLSDYLPQYPYGGGVMRKLHK